LVNRDQIRSNRDEKKKMGSKTSTNMVALLLSLLILIFTLSSQVKVVEATSRKLGKYLSLDAYNLITSQSSDRIS
jgi:hypothetical protein